MRGSGIRRAAAQIFGRLARLEQPPLRRREALVGDALIVVQPRDRRARFFLTPIETVALLFRLPPFARELIGSLREPRGLVGRPLQLQLVRENHFLLLVVLAAQRGERVRCLGDGCFEPRSLFREPRERAALRLDAAVELLDLALRLENAARFVAAAAGHQTRAAEDLACAGDDRERAVAARSRRALVRVCDPRVLQRFGDRGGMRAVHADDGGQGQHAVGPLAWRHIGGGRGGRFRGHAGR